MRRVILVGGYAAGRVFDVSDDLVPFIRIAEPPQAQIAPCNAPAAAVVPDERIHEYQLQRLTGNHWIGHPSGYDFTVDLLNTYIAAMAPKERT